MTSTKNIEHEICRFLNSAEPEVLCITGEWGIGKTFLWNKLFNQLKKDQTIALDDYAYVSLFGCNTLEALKLEIFENSENIKPKKRGSQLEPAMKQVSFLAKQIRKLRGTAAEAPIVGAWIKAGSGLFFQSVKNQIICIDDLDRRGIGLRVLDLLGLVSLLREQRGCKVVLILNEEKLEESERAEFVRQLEKTVDVKLNFDPSPGEAATIAFQNGDFVSTQLKEHCPKLGINNIRVMKKIERSARTANAILNEHSEELRASAIQSIALFGWSLFEPDSAPPKKLILRNRNAEWVDISNRTQTPEEVEWNEVLRDYGVIDISNLDLELFDSLEKGFFDSETIKRHAKEIEDGLQTRELDNAIHDAWEMFHGQLKGDTDEFVEKLIEATINYIPHLSGTNLESTIRLLKELGKQGEASDLLHEFMKNAVRSNEFWLRQEFQSEEIVDSDIIAAFDQKAAASSPKIDEREILLRCSSRDSWSPEDIAALSRLSPINIVDLIKSLDGSQLKDGKKFLLMAKSLSNPSEETITMTENTVEAFRIIAAEGGLNRVRMKWHYGIEPESPRKI